MRGDVIIGCVLEMPVVLSDDDVLKLLLTDLVLAPAALLAGVPGPGGGGLQHRQPDAVIHAELHHALLHQ